MGPRVPFVSNPFGAISPNKVVETKNLERLSTKCRSMYWPMYQPIPRSCIGQHIGGRIDRYVNLHGQ